MFARRAPRYPSSALPLLFARRATPPVRAPRYPALPLLRATPPGPASALPLLFARRATPPATRAALPLPG